VHRDGKYKVDYTEYNKTHYPPFASGATMFFSRDIMARLVDIFPREKVFRLEDVYIGILIDKLGINATESDQGRKHGYWEIYLFSEGSNNCDIYKHAIIRHIYFWEHDKRWCVYQLYDES